MKERVKEILTSLRLVLGIILSAFLTLVAFVFSSFEKLPTFKAVFAIAGLVALALILLILVFLLIFYTQKLKD